MSRFFGPIAQVAYVVSDLEPLISHLTGTLGVGPFFLLPTPVELDWVKYRGKEINSDDLFGAVALGYSGDVNIEIIVPGRAPSHYHEFLSAGCSGVHHLGTFATDYDAELEAARAAGLSVVLEGSGAISRFAYIETDVGFPGTMIELLAVGSEMKAVLEQIHDAAKGWDGKDPIRDLAALSN
jgi:Glyoxalase/Bleomycin resistance protein/Dioxygenase superfamily